jgi:putative glycosyltransferase (TIGR04372 family)
MFFYRVLGVLLNGLGVRFVNPANPQRVGHLALDFDSYLKERLLNGRRRKPIYLVDFRRPANAALLEYWRQYLWIVDGRLSRMLQPFLKIPELVDDLMRFGSAMTEPSCSYDVEGRWRGRRPLLTLKEQHRRDGQDTLVKMGIPQNAWFVCIHSREGGYSPTDEHVHDYRNSPIEDYIPAMQEIVRRGGWCIRVGDSTMRPLPRLEQTVDYALSPSKSDWMDIFLCASCRFFLGNSSGVYFISTIFGKPAGLANMAPMGSAYSPAAIAITIPKLYRNSEGRPLSFQEIYNSPVADYRFSARFAEAGISVIDNSPDDITELAVEMIERLQGTFLETPADAVRQERFRALVKPHNYCWPPPSRIGTLFLRKYEYLL